PDTKETPADGAGGRSVASIIMIAVLVRPRMFFCERSVRAVVPEVGGAGRFAERVLNPTRHLTCKRNAGPTSEGRKGAGGPDRRCPFRRDPARRGRLSIGHGPGAGENCLTGV